jgi:hypothetical protein
MRILQNSNVPLHEPASASAQASSGDPERLDALEKVATTILQRIQVLEKRIETLEAAPQTTEASPLMTPEPAPIAPTTTPPADIRIDPAALKKDLLSKMWTYLNEEGCR